MSIAEKLCVVFCSLELALSNSVTVRSASVAVSMEISRRYHSGSNLLTSQLSAACTWPPVMGKKSSPSTTSAQTRAAFTVPPPAGWVGHSPSTSTSGNSAPTLPCCKSPGPLHGCSLALQPCPVLLQCAVPAAALHHCCFPLQPSEPRLTLPLALSLRFGFGTLLLLTLHSRPAVLAPLTCAVCAA